MDVLNLMLSSGISSIVARTIVSPIDKYIIFKQTNTNIKKQNGLKYIFKGNLINNIRVTINNVIELTLFEVLKKNNDKKNYYLYYGMISGLASNSITYPLDTIRTNYICDKKAKISNLYKGFNASIFGYTIYTGIRIGIYNMLKNDNYINKIMSALLSTSLGLLVAYPIETIKRMKQIHDIEYKNIKLNSKLYNGLKLAYYKNIPLNIIILTFNDFCKK